MKILCDRAALLEAVSVVSSVVPAKTTKPILQNLLLRADGDGMSLFATDLEIAAKVEIDSVKVTRKGAVLVPARETAALLRELTDPTVTLETSDQRCRIDSGGGSFVLLGDDVEQYPQEAKIQSGRRIELSGRLLLRMIQETMFAAAREETRYAINGVLIDVAGGCVRLVATDGRRLAISYVNLDDGDAAEVQFRVLVPLRALATLARALTDESKDMIAIEVGDKQVVFRTGRMHLVSQLLETRFPDYEAVMPNAAETTVEIQRSLLEGALRRVSILCANELRMVRFEVGDQTMRMTAESATRGRADVVIDAVVKGAGGSINFNPDYILEALRQSKLDQLRLDMSDDSMPAKFTLGESFTYVVMPISGG